MRRLLSVLVVTVIVVGCGSPKPDDVVKELIGQWDKAAAVLEGVHDEAGARAAGKKLEAVAQKIVVLNRQATDLDLKLTADDRWHLDVDNREEVKASLKRFNEAARKVKDVPGGTELVIRFQRMASRAF